MGKPKIIKTDKRPCLYWKKFPNILPKITNKHVTGIPYNAQGQGIVERAHQTIKNTFNKLEKGELYAIKGSPRIILHHTLFILNFLNLDSCGKSAADRLWHPETNKNYATAMSKDPLTSKWNGPDPVLIWGRGSAYIYDTKEDAARGLPERLIKQVNTPTD